MPRYTVNRTVKLEYDETIELEEVNDEEAVIKAHGAGNTVEPPPGSPYFRRVYVKRIKRDDGEFVY